MPVLGITGGVGSGKSSFTELLRPALAARHFDADACARQLVDSDPGVREEIRAEFGPAVVADNGEVDRLRLRAVVFADATKRRALEEIVHPRIRSKWTVLADGFRGQASKQWLLVEIPLLFETKAEALFDQIVVVGCTQFEQRQRLINDRHLSPDLVDRMIAAQLPLAPKLIAADYLIWNTGGREILSAQVDLLAKKLKDFHG